MSILVRTLTIVLFSMALSHCGLSPVPMPQMVTYTLKPVAARVNTSQHTSRSLLIATPDSEPGYDSSRIAYRKQENQIEYYAKHQWLASPARMLSPLIVQAIENTGYYRSVVGAPFSGITTRRLNTRVLYWVQDMEGSRNQLYLAVRVSLIDVASGKLISAKTIAIEEPVLALNPDALAHAANRGSTKLLNQIAAFCLQ
jgi:cholesterol transport system auxiliary component